MSSVICRDNNVIYADFTEGWRKAAAEIVTDLVYLPGNSAEYMRICAATLDENDYWDLVEAISSPEAYDDCDDEIQLLADGYFDLTS
jgi:hypothetical protein